MTRFLINLEDGASEFHRALIVDRMTEQFSGVEFICGYDPPAGLENSIMPLLGRPHPTEPDCTLITHPPAGLAQWIKKAFRDALPIVKARQPS